MSRNKYYKGYFHDYELDYIESVNDEYYIVPKDAKTYTDENGDKKYTDETKITLRPNVRRGEEILIYRECPKGKKDKEGLYSPMCDFREHFRERIKAPKGYLKRANKFKREVAK